MTNALQKPDTVKGILSLDQYKARFTEVLGRRAPQFMASICNLSTQAGFDDCAPLSIIASGFVAATLDLPVDRNLGFAWVVPYRDRRSNRKLAQFQIGYKGIIQLALRSGQYKRMNALPINAEAYNGLDDIGEPVIEWKKVDETKEPVGYAVGWQLVNGFVKVAYWSKEKVVSHARRYSRAVNDGPWKTHFDEMALKTVIRNELSKWGILSIEMQTAMRHDQGTQTDIDEPVIHVDSTAEPLEAVIGDFPSAENQDADFGPMPHKPLPDAVAKAQPPKSAEPELPPNKKLEALLEEWGHSFDTLVKWCKATGNYDDADSCASFEDFPNDIAQRLIRAKVGLKRGLDQVSTAKVS